MITASIRLIERVERATEVFRPLTRRIIKAEGSTLEVWVDGKLYRTADEPIELKLKEDGRIAVVKVPFVVSEFETRTVYR